MSPARSEPARSLLGFWVSEGVAPGLALAGFVTTLSLQPPPLDFGFPIGLEAGNARDWISPADITELH